jgi:geranylgeranyl reductase family protein
MWAFGRRGGGVSVRYDVAVIGAGPGGAAAAHWLARNGASVLLLDKADFPRDKTCGDGLSPRAWRALDELGLLTDLLRRGHRTGCLHIAAPRGHAVTAAIPGRGARPSQALVVPRLALDDLVRRRALASGATFESPVRVTAIEQERDGVRVCGERGGRAVAYGARLAVVATGAAQGLLEQLQLPTSRPTMVAARAYYEGIDGLPDRLAFHFDGVPLPGYGWAFPLSPTAANVGAGVLMRRLIPRRRPVTARAAFDRFVAHPRTARLLGGARRVGPVQGFPLRAAFDRSPTYGERMLLVGEAAGLVNPLSGEGIDYALESGQLAAAFIAERLADDDLSRAALAGYDRLLRARYQRLFVFCRRVTDLALNPVVLDPLVALARRRPDLKDLLVNIVLGVRDLSGDLSLRRVARALLSL